MDKPKTLLGSEYTERQTCKQHGEYEANVMEVYDKKIRTGCPDCAELLAEMEAAKEADRKEKQFEHMKALAVQRSNVPLRFKSSSFENYKPISPAAEKAKAICERYCELWVERSSCGGGMLLAGKPGTGKTHLACAMIMELAQTRALNGVYTTAPKAMRFIKSTYSKDSEITEHEAFDRLMSPALLVIDEVGVQFGSKAELMILFEIINGRYEQMLPTILLSNLTVPELEQEIGERVVDRMRENGAVISFDWESYRK